MAPFVVKAPYPSLDEAASELGLSKRQVKSVDQMLIEAPPPRLHRVTKGSRKLAKKAAKKTR
jgi:hypothetical protein